MKQNIHHVRQMRMRCVVFLIFTFSHFLIFTIGAQTFTQRLQTVKGKEGRMTITHSQKIDELVNGPHAQPSVIQPSAVQGSSSATADKTGDKTANSITKDNRPASVATRPSNTVVTEQVRDTVDIILNDQPRKKVMRNSYKINGYRVQAFAGGNQRKDKQRAEQVGSDIKQHFPDEPVYTHFYSPRWICRVGNYRTYEEAHEMLLNIRQLGYTSATIVKGKITVQY